MSFAWSCAEEGSVDDDSAIHNEDLEGMDERGDQNQMRASLVSPIRIAVVGARRGEAFVRSAETLGAKLSMVAICDQSPEKLAPWEETDVRCYLDYDQVLEDKEIDAVCLATPVGLHARQAIDALRAGKHVLCEVPAADSLEDCRELIKAVEETGLVYMMAENYCYRRDVLMVEEMVRRGVFGELTYAEGSYLHDCRNLFLDHEGALTWRGELNRTRFCNWYPTHSMGPVSRWLGINRGDRYLSLSAWQSGAFACADYTRRNFGAEHEMADRAQWRIPDSVITSLRSEKGVLVHHRLDTASPRPHHVDRYALQGTRASFTSNFSSQFESQIWIQGRSPTTSDGRAEEWEPLFKYADEFEHPLWREWGAEAAKSGHGGGDFFALREFADSIFEARAPWIDVYDAVTWSSIGPLSGQSMEEGNRPVEVPDFAPAGKRSESGV